jgi:hypothetical protein
VKRPSKEPFPRYGVGDLIKDIEYGDLGLVLRYVGMEEDNYDNYYILNMLGKVEWFSRSYIEEFCEIVNEYK